MHTCKTCGNEYSVEFAFCTECGASNPLLEKNSDAPSIKRIPESIGKLDDPGTMDISLDETTAVAPGQ